MVNHVHACVRVRLHGLWPGVTHSVVISVFEIRLLSAVIMSCVNRNGSMHKYASIILMSCLY